MTTDGTKSTSEEAQPKEPTAEEILENQKKKEQDQLKVDAYNHQTWRHIHRVQQILLLKAIPELLKRAHRHDQSKLETPESEGFANAVPLKDLTIGSDEYNASKKSLDKVLKHHHAKNRHHPEHFKNGVEEMDLFDIMEMLVDWTASAERQDDGNIRLSLEKVAEKFNIDPYLIRIMENTLTTLMGD